MFPFGPVQRSATNPEEGTMNSPAQHPQRLEGPQCQDPSVPEIPFERLWQRIGAKTPADSVYRRVREHYDQPSRFYPTYDDIWYQLRLIDIMGDAIEAPDVIRLSVIFHALFAEAAMPPEECARMSAGFCVVELQQAQVPAAIIANVQRQILRQTASPCVTGDDAYFGDFIRAHWGLPPELYGSHRERIWQQLGADDYPNAFWELRRPFLLHQIQQTRTFGTPYFESNYGEQARRNLKAELALFID
jgi:predicted metal-dependent HD superfamily phosphohydrolase